MKYPLKFTMILVGLAVTLAVAPASSSIAKIEQIKPEELKKLIDSNDPTILVVDNQPKGVYDLGHIKGAVNFPWAMDIKSPGNLPRDRMLILYCDCAHADRSTELALQLSSEPDSCAADDDSTAVAEQLMNKFGYRNIKVLEGGWSKWLQLGYPVDKKTL